MSGKSPSLRQGGLLIDENLSSRVADCRDVDPHPALLAQMAIANLTTRCGDLDVAFTPTGIQGHAELIDAAVVFEIEGRVVPVAALHHIIRSKEAADRPKDRAVLPILYALPEETENGS